MSSSKHICRQHAAWRRRETQEDEEVEVRLDFKWEWVHVEHKHGEISGSFPHRSEWK